MGYKVEEGELTLTNGLFVRRIELPEKSGHYLLKEYRPAEKETEKSKFDFFEPTSEEFSFVLGGVTYTGASRWQQESIEAAREPGSGQGVTVTLQAPDAGVQVRLTYLWYDGLPFIRKRLQICNATGAKQRLESVDVEKLAVTEFYAPSYSWIYSDYGRKKSIGAYRGNLQDSLIVVHHPEWECGIVLGNEAPGVLKGASVWSRGREITLGLTHSEEDFPFRKYLAPQELFTVPEVFTGVYSRQPDIHVVLNQMVADYLRNCMDLRINKISERPTCVYNTWEPFEFDISEQLVMETAAAAAKAGVKEYVIDDGWADCYGDWGVDKAKFPNGLKPVVDHIKSLGMKAGIWVRIGTAAPDSKVYKAHPDWFFKGKDGKDISLVIDADDKCTAFFSTGWADYITEVLERLVDEYGFEYLKLDFSVVTSPYRYSKEEAGCYAHDHPAIRTARNPCGRTMTGCGRCSISYTRDGKISSSTVPLKRWAAYNWSITPCSSTRRETGSPTSRGTRAKRPI